MKCAKFEVAYSTQFKKPAGVPMTFALSGAYAMPPEVVAAARETMAGK